MKLLVPNYSCLQNPWLGGLPPPDPRSLCPQLNLLKPPNKIPGYATGVDKIQNFLMSNTVECVIIAGILDWKYIFAYKMHIIVTTPLDEWSAGRRDLYPTTHNTQQQTDTHALGKNGTHRLSRRAAANPLLRPRGHWDRPSFNNRFEHLQYDSLFLPTCYTNSLS